MDTETLGMNDCSGTKRLLRSLKGFTLQLAIFARSRKVPGESRYKIDTNKGCVDPDHEALSSNFELKTCWPHMTPHSGDEVQGMLVRIQDSARQRAMFVVFHLELSSFTLLQWGQ